MSRNRFLRLAVPLLLVMVVLSGCGTPAQPALSATLVPLAQPPATPAPPTATLESTATPAEPVNFTIASIPAGSEVYIASVEELGISLYDQADWSDVTRQLLGLKRVPQKDRLLLLTLPAAKYARGTAPLALNLEPGAYLVGLGLPADATQFADVAFSDFDAGCEFGPSLSGEHQGVAFRFYLVDLQSDNLTNLIHIWQPRAWSLAQVESLYPEEEVFLTNDESITATLQDNQVTDGDITAILRMLRRGGKVVYRADDVTTYTLEVALETGELSTFLGWEEED